MAQKLWGPRLPASALPSVCLCLSVSVGPGQVLSFSNSVHLCRGRLSVPSLCLPGPCWLRERPRQTRLQLLQAVGQAVHCTKAPS